jgi:hypothetical protein
MIWLDFYWIMPAAGSSPLRFNWVLRIGGSSKYEEAIITSTAYER